MLLAGLMGCTGMDVASLLRKMQVPVATIALDSCADVVDQDPHVFTAIELNYRFDGPEDLVRSVDKIRKAIHMSKDKLCCVSIMFNRFCPIHTRAYVNGAEIDI
jgi:putative redox protein